MKGTRVLFIAAGLVVVLAQCALCVQVWTTPQKITTSGTWFRGGPVAYGDKVYFNDRRSGKSEIYVWDQAGGERLYMSGTLSTSVRAVYGEKLVYSTYNSGLYSLYLHDPAIGDRLISPTYSGSGSAIYGDTVAFEDNRSGFQQIYTWDPVNGERHLNPTSYDQMNPRIWGNKVVYEDYQFTEEDPRYSDPPDLYTWDPVNGNIFLARYGQSPVIYQDDIYAYMYGSYSGGLWKSGPGGWVVSGPGIGLPSGVWDDLVVMYNGYSWDPVHGAVQITSMGGTQYSLYGRQVAWQKSNGIYTDIYVSTYVPEPSGACALGLLLGSGCVPLIRRRRVRI